MNKISDINLIGKLACNTWVQPPRLWLELAGWYWIAIQATSVACVLELHVPLLQLDALFTKGGNLRARMHTCIQPKQLQFWNNTMFNVEFDPWMCMIFKEDIYVHDCYLNGRCIGHRPNLRRVVIGWTMTFKNIKFNTCLSFPRIRISSLCHMWPGKFLVL